MSVCTAAASPFPFPLRWQIVYSKKREKGAMQAFIFFNNWLSLLTRGSFLSHALFLPYFPSMGCNEFWSKLTDKGYPTDEQIRSSGERIPEWDKVPQTTVWERWAYYFY